MFIYHMVHKHQWIIKSSLYNFNKLYNKMKQTPKKLLHEAWESWKKAIENWKRAVKDIWFVINNTVAWLFNTLKAWYKVLDAWDKAIWNSIEKNLQKRGKGTNEKISKFFRDNIMKLLLFTSVITTWWVQTAQYVKEKNNDNTEVIINDDEGEIKNAIKEIFENEDVINDIQWDWKVWQDKRKNNYLWNNEFWNENYDWLNQRKKVIEWFCKMLESWDIDMIFEKADSAWVPRQCIYLALAESWWTAGANSWVATWYRQFTNQSAISFGLNEKWGPDNRWDKVKSTEAAMRHLKANYDIVCNYANQLWYHLTESDKWMLSFYMYNWSPKLVRSGMVACKWDISKYPDKLKPSKWKKENNNYVPRILGIQDALEEIFKQNDYDIQKVKVSANIVTHVKTTADDLYEEYQKNSSSLNIKDKITTLRKIKWQYKNEYESKKISKSYYEWAIRAIDEVIQGLENSD